MNYSIIFKKSISITLIFLYILSISLDWLNQRCDKRNIMSPYELRETVSDERLLKWRTALAEECLHYQYKSPPPRRRIYTFISMNIRKHGSDACQALGDPSFLEQGKLRWMVSLKLPKKDLLRNNFKSEPVNNQNYYFLLQFLNTFFSKSQNHCFFKIWGDN